MIQKALNPAAMEARAGLEMSCLAASDISRIKLSLPDFQAQYLTRRFRISSARARIIADLYFGGDAGGCC